MMSNRARLAVAMLTTGAALLLGGCWIEAKAWIAQRLLERSWIAHLEDGRAPSDLVDEGGEHVSSCASIVAGLPAAPSTGW